MITSVHVKTDACKFEIQHKNINNLTIKINAIIISKLKILLPECIFALKSNINREFCPIITSGILIRSSISIIIRNPKVNIKV